MRILASCILVIGLNFTSCNQGKQPSYIDGSSQSNDEQQILDLVKKVLEWGDSKNSVDLLPTLTDSIDSIYIGFDLEKLKQNIIKLKNTNLFTDDFIENYNQIILTLDKGLRNGEYEQWLVGDLPTFIFANDYSPWWDGQESFPLEKGVIERISSDDNNGEYYFKCGSCEGLEYYKMRFRVSKVSFQWKISFLEGFEFKESTRKDGV
jgi:hypothetical protein